MIRMRKRAPYRDSRPPERIRRLRRMRRGRNLLFLIIFLGMFGLGFNRVIAYEKMLFWLLLGIAGIVLWFFLYITLGQLLTFAWQRFIFTLPRLWRFALPFLLIWPLFLLDEGIHRGYQEQGTIRAIAGSLAFKLLLIVGLCVAILITPGLNFLSIVLPVLVLIFLLLVAFGTQIYASGRAAITAATLSALILAWCMSTTLPIN